jgi:putative ABC transport system permease protein
MNTAADRITLLPPGVARLRAAQLWRLAWHDLVHERWLAFCAACVLAATLAPLATLWGLERGVIGTLIERLDRDPLMREIVPKASGASRLDAAWFERVRRWPEVAFAIGTVRSSAALVELVSDTAPAPTTLELRPTARGDPLLAGLAPPSGSAIVLSADAARQLKAKRGDTLAIPFQRTREGRDERAAIRVSVADVLPLAVSDGGHALAAPPLVEAIEAWRDGYRVDGFGDAGSGPPPARTSHPLFRMYATSIRSVEALAARLEAEGVSTDIRGRDIAATLGLQRNLRAVLALVAAVTLAGAVVALTAMQVATVRRKRREHALLKLTGHGRAWLVALPCLHALAVALGGSLLAFAVYRVGAALINSHFAAHLAPGEAAVRLGGADVAVGVLAAAIVSVLPALWGGWRASNVEAADELREQ